MSIVDGKGLIVWEGGLFEPGSDLLRRVQWAFAQIRADGGTIILNEAGRPFGVPGDANVRSSSQTASGLSTVWFQWGRYLRGETPSAADPRSGNVYASEHTQGIAIDCNAVDVYTTTLRAKYFPQAGLRNTISSESWHWAIRGNPVVNLGTSTASTGSKPITPKPPTLVEEEEETMEKTRGAQYVGADKVRRFIIFNMGSGFYAEHSGADGDYNNPIALAWETGAWPTITAKHADVIRASCAAVRAGK